MASDDADYDAAIEALNGALRRIFPRGRVARCEVIDEKWRMAPQARKFLDARYDPATWSTRANGNDLEILERIAAGRSLHASDEVGALNIERLEKFQDTVRRVQALHEAGLISAPTVRKEKQTGRDYVEYVAVDALTDRGREILAKGLVAAFRE